MEPTFPLHQVRQVIRGTSSTPNISSNVASPNHPLHTNPNKITLDLNRWKTLNGKPRDKESARNRIEEILQFFLNISWSNNLSPSPAVQTLQNSLSVLRRGGDFSRDAAQKCWRKRIAQASAPKTNHDPVSTLRNLCLHGFPIFNIWDSISFIYTLCVEDIKGQLGAELHLYQFRLILKALRDCETYFVPFAGPTTVAASWTVQQNQPLAIAFATTAVGEKGDNTKELICRARQEFMATFKKVLTKESKNVSTRNSPPNRPGNCPEYLIWPVVCWKGVGKYKSLCFNVPAPRAYRCCGHCEKILEKMGANGIQIDDIWATAILSTGPVSTKGPYPFRELNENIVEQYQRY